MVPATLYRAIEDAGEKVGLTQNRMATKILADHFGMAVKLPKMLRRSLEAPFEKREWAVAEPSGEVATCEAPPNVPAQSRTCFEHNTAMLDYGTEWYCLMGNHSEEKNA